MKVPHFLRFLTRPQGDKVGHIETLTGQDLAKFLTDFGPEEMRGMREIWKKYAARGELIDLGVSTDGGKIIQP